MKKFPHLLVFAVFFGALIAYTGWANQPPPESALASISGRVVDVERVTRTRWDRRNLIPGEVYVGHDLAVRSENGEVITVRVPDWEGIPEPVSRRCSGWTFADDTILARTFFMNWPPDRTCLRRIIRVL